MHLAPWDVARLFAGASLLAFASYTDWRWRRAPDALWIAGALAGAALLAAQAVAEPAVLGQWMYLVLGAGFAAMVFACYWLGLIAGGADAKALMMLALLVPFPVHLGALPLLPSPMPPAFGVLGNALLAFLLVPLALLARNLARGHAAWPFAVLGLRMPVAEARRRHLWPMEYVQDGKVRTMLFPSRFLWEDEDWDALEAAGRREVWVTPKVPFMLPILAGLGLEFFGGDLLYQAVGALLGGLGR